MRKEFSGQLHKFMASLTETANHAQGHTVLYFPNEDLGSSEDIDKAVKVNWENIKTFFPWKKKSNRFIIFFFCGLLFFFFFTFRCAPPTKKSC